MFDKSKAWRTTVPLELIYFDVCGPLKVTSGGNKYFVTFIDDCTKKFKVMVELQSVYKVKNLRSDRGGKYISIEFQKILWD